MIEFIATRLPEDGDKERASELLLDTKHQQAMTATLSNNPSSSFLLRRGEQKQSKRFHDCFPHPFDPSPCRLMKSANLHQRK
ncbi:hypothetical protein RRG08_011824 [Elysia crispata]|uniref:Uncharacterized protein n=1 Tax=Elysia crispata TaxID=231223 RepID=A0AAE0ZL15_9GAST|nr:hypothetical protein RRG08_011824 [Elysia crispata]